MNLAELQKVHAHQTWAFGLLPPTLNLLNLLIASAVIATGAWLWGGAVAGLLGFLPVYAESIACVLGVTFVNFWFSKEIQTTILNIKESLSGRRYQNENINLRKTFKMTNDVVNRYFRRLYGDKHVDLVMGRLGAFEAKDQGYKFVGVTGRNGANSIYAISQTVLDKQSTMKPKHIAVWLIKEQIKSYYNRGWSNFFISMFEALSSTLTSLQESPSFIPKMIGLIASPLQFLLLLPKLIRRAHEYEAWREVVRMGYGFEAIEHLDIKGDRNRAQDVEPWVAIKRKMKQFAKRKPYTGWFASILSPITNWMDRFLEKNEWAFDDKSDWRLFSVANVIFLNIGRWVKELFADSPSGFNIKEVLKNDIEGYKQANDALKKELKDIYSSNKSKTQQKRLETRAVNKYKTALEQIKVRERQKQSENAPAKGSTKVLHRKYFDQENVENQAANAPRTNNPGFAPGYQAARRRMSDRQAQQHQPSNRSSARHRVRFAV